MATFVNNTMGRLKTITEDIAKFDKSEHQTADSMSQWRANVKQQKRLRQLLKDLVAGLIDAAQSLHELDFVSLNLHGEY